jgi:hypothetical protein
VILIYNWSNTHSVLPSVQQLVQIGRLFAFAGNHRNDVVDDQRGDHCYQQQPLTVHRKILVVEMLPDVVAEYTEKSKSCANIDRVECGMGRAC